jgi:AcrR family transcriptional regulator
VSRSGAATAHSVTTSAPAARPSVPGQSQRERILDITLELMAQKGASATSMRALAAACGLNVAALYHYFSSKDALLRAVIEERRYGAQLESMSVPDLRLPAPERLVALVVAMWEGALAEAPIWRLLLSEALHGDATAREVGDDLRITLESALGDALARLVPELAVPLDVAARTVAGALFALLLEATLVDPDAMAVHAERRAADLAVLLLQRR